MSGKKTHPVLTEKLTLDRANIMFLWNYTSFIIVLNNNSHPQPEKGRFMLDKNLVPKISKFHVSIVWQRFLYYSTVSFVQK